MSMFADLFLNYLDESPEKYPATYATLPGLFSSGPELRIAWERLTFGGEYGYNLSIHHNGLKVFSMWLNSDGFDRFDSAYKVESLAASTERLQWIADHFEQTEQGS